MFVHHKWKMLGNALQIDVACIFECLKFFCTTYWICINVTRAFNWNAKRKTYTRTRFYVRFNGRWELFFRTHRNSIDRSYWWDMRNELIWTSKIKSDKKMAAIEYRNWNQYQWSDIRNLLNKIEKANKFRLLLEIIENCTLV